MLLLFYASLTPLILYLSLKLLFRSYFGRWYWNYLVSFHPLLAYILPKGHWGPIAEQGPPRIIPEILNTKWMGEWDLPELTSPTYRSHHPLTLGSGSPSHGRYRDLTSPALVKLHIFSIPTASAASKRRQIRRLSPLLSIPPKYHHLIEIKFVIGLPLYADGSLNEEMEKQLEEEQEEHGDLLRLRGLKNGENIQEGKIMHWMRTVGLQEDGGREAWWVFKMDDDTVINLPNFLDDLLTLDPRVPRYLGTSLCRWPAYHYHFTGLLTGYNYGVLKTLASGIKNMKPEDVDAWWDDDVLMGELMFTLPSQPDRGHSEPKPQSPKWGYLPPPPTLDPRTGLKYHNYLRRAGDKCLPWIKGDIARHPFKSEGEFEREWEGRIRGGRKWVGPEWMRGLEDS